MGQIWQAKIQDALPEFPLAFPDTLKSSIANGWSKKLRERPKIEEFRSALSLLLKQDDQRSLRYETTITACQLNFLPQIHNYIQSKCPLT